MLFRWFIRARHLPLLALLLAAGGCETRFQYDVIDIRTVTYEDNHVFFEMLDYWEPPTSAAVVDIRIRADRDLRRLNNRRGLYGYTVEVFPCGQTEPYSLELKEQYTFIGSVSREEPPDDPQTFSILVDANAVGNLFRAFPGLRDSSTAGAPYCMELSAGNMLGMSAKSQHYQLSTQQMEAILSLVQDKYRNNPE